MRFSKFFLKTTKNTSDDEKVVSSKFLKQGGFIRESVAGRYYFLPLGLRVQKKIMAIIKEEMDAAGGQEMIVPTLHPLDLWKETNRTKTTGFELMCVKDRRDTEFALGGTAEEMFVDLVRQYRLSYRDLPLHLYQFSTKFRDELRVRGGLLRVREFIMKDGYSFHTDASDFKIEYEKMKEVYFKIFSRLGLNTSAVESDNGYIGGEYCHEFVVESEIGESKYFVSESGDYAAHEEVAVFKKDKINISEPLSELVEVPAIRGVTMEDGASFHGLPIWQQIKSVLFVDENNRFILAIIRGDLDVNETKLKHLIGSVTLRHATEEEVLNKVNSIPGFISPVQIRDSLIAGFELVIVADDSLLTISNAYCGGNRKHIDLLNVNYGRDYTWDIEGDIAQVKPGYLSKSSESILIEKKGIEVGNIFQLGYHYSNLMKGATFIDTDGSEKPFYMGCYGIGVGRTMAAIVEKHNDSLGIIWPKEVSPFDVHLIALDGVEAVADLFYNTLLKKGIDVFYDDREKTAGEKFADADLIGIPVRVLISKKTLQKQCCEIKKRNETESKLVSLEKAVDLLL